MAYSGHGENETGMRAQAHLPVHTAPELRPVTKGITLNYIHRRGLIRELVSNHRV